LIAYLGFDPFTDPTLGRPKGDETSALAFLSFPTAMTLGKRIKECRFKLKKTRRKMAKELGVSVKILWGWETERWEPNAEGQKLVASFLDIHG
jgi:DNA-binding transcriptional regulator YiaG